MTVELTPVKSSNIAAANYDADTLVLTIRFGSGATYEYRNVPEELGKGFFEAESIGKYFFGAIKSSFEGVRIDEEEKAE